MRIRLLVFFWNFCLAIKFVTKGRQDKQEANGFLTVKVLFKRTPIKGGGETKRFYFAFLANKVKRNLFKLFKRFHWKSPKCYKRLYNYFALIIHQLMYSTPFLLLRLSLSFFLSFSLSFTSYSYLIRAKRG